MVMIDDDNNVDDDDFELLELLLLSTICPSIIISIHPSTYLHVGMLYSPSSGLPAGESDDR